MMLRRDGFRTTLFLVTGLTFAITAGSQAYAQAPSPAGPLQPLAPVAPAPPPVAGSVPATNPLATNVPPTNTAPSTTPPAVPPGEATAPSLPPASAPTGNVYAYNLASIPDMIGDTPLGGRYLFFGTSQTGAVTIPIAGGDGFAKIADDNSPIPTDRVFLDDNFYNRAVISGNGGIVDLNRFTFGFEKTFFDGFCSIQVESPLDSGLSANQDVGDTTGENQGTVFGNLSLTLKCLLYQNDSFAVSAGAMLGLPTAPQGSFTFFENSLTIKNQSVHVAPFLGFVCAPNSNFFAIGFAQVDLNTGGDSVMLDGEVSDPEIRDPGFLYLDLAMGYWIFHDQPMFDRYLSGVSPTVELHYSTALGTYQGDGEFFVPLYGGLDELDLTTGAHFEFGPKSMLTVAGVVPLRADYRDRNFDSEIVMEFDRRF